MSPRTVVRVTQEKEKRYIIFQVFFNFNGFKCKAGLYVKHHKLKCYVGSLIQFIFKHLYLGWESGSIQLEEDFLKHLKVFSSWG